MAHEEYSLRNLGKLRLHCTLRANSLHLPLRYYLHVLQSSSTLGCLEWTIEPLFTHWQDVSTPISVRNCYGVLPFSGPFPLRADDVFYGISWEMDTKVKASVTKAQSVVINKAVLFFQPIAFAVICTLERSPLPVPPLFQTMF